jgi:hypothetical protein
MPYDTHYVDSGKGIHKIGTGVVTSTEILLSAMKESMDEERARKLRYGLIDFTQTTEFRMTPEGVRQLVEINRKMARFTVGAFVAVVAPTPLTYGISRLWQTFSEDLGWKASVSFMIGPPQSRG